MSAGDERVRGCVVHADHAISRHGEPRGLSVATLESDLLNAQWTSLRESVIECIVAAAARIEEERAGDGAASRPPRHLDLGKMVPLVDVSGSMTGLPMRAAIGLGILVSDMTNDAFRNHGPMNRCLTFETQPRWVDLGGCGTVGDKVRRLQSAEWGGSTNFVAACELILESAQRAKLSPEEIPDLIVFSDMQFDQAQDPYSSWVRAQTPSTVTGSGRRTSSVSHAGSRRSALK